MKTSDIKRFMSDFTWENFVNAYGDYLMNYKDWKGDDGDIRNLEALIVKNFINVYNNKGRHLLPLDMLDTGDYVLMDDGHHLTKKFYLGDDGTFSLFPPE